MENLNTPKRQIKWLKDRGLLPSQPRWNCKLMIRRLKRLNKKK